MRKMILRKVVWDVGFQKEMGKGYFHISNKGTKNLII